MHLAAPFEIAGGKESLAETGRAAEVRRQHRIAAVGQELVQRVVAIDVPRPRTAVGHKHQRNRRLRPACPVRVAARRQGEIGGLHQPVARADLHRMHGRQHRSGQLRPGQIELGQLAARPLIEPGRRGRGDRIDAHHPEIVRMGARGDRDFTLQGALQEVQIGLHGRVERDPLGGQIGGRIGFHPSGNGVEHGVGDVDPGVFRQHGAGARGHVLGDQGGGVATAGVDPVERLAVGGEAQRIDGGRIVEADAFDGLGPGDAVLDAVIVLAAIRPGPRAAAHRQGLVDQERAEAIILEHQDERARGEVERIDVVPARIAVVHPDQDAVGDLGADLEDLGAGLVEGGQRLGLTALGGDAVELEILIAALVVDVEHRG